MGVRSMISVNIRHSLGPFTLNVRFSAGRGVTALYGRSGAGKTSVLSAVAGLLSPGDGLIVAGERTLFDSASGIDVPIHKRRIGTVFQDGRLFPHMSVAGNLRFAERFGAGGPSERMQLVELLGIGHLLRRRPGDLSGGEKQRVAIARALLQKPDALLLDEPLAALDDARKAEILPYLDRLGREVGIPMLYVSHAMQEVARLADCVVLLREGKSIRAGPVQEVFADAGAAVKMGVRDAGALIDCKVAGHDAADNLTEVALSSAKLVLPRIDATVGTPVRIRLRATEVIIATAPLGDVSTRNVIPVTVTEVKEGEGPGALVALVSGSDQLLARVTKRAARALSLHPGLSCYAVLKVFAVAPEDIVLRA